MSRGRTATTRRALLLAIVGVVTLAVGHFEMSTAWAAPCCQECPGWPDPPVGPDRCWDNCNICFAADEPSPDLDRVDVCELAPDALDRPDDGEICLAEDAPVDDSDELAVQRFGESSQAMR